jgi:hypothetical protein
MRHFFVSAMFIGTLLLLSSKASAHFLWLDTQIGSDGANHARLIFSDLPQPAGRDLSAKVSHSKLWSRTADGKFADLSFRPGTAGDAKTLVANVPSFKGICIEASCDYGVYTHGEQNSLLHYYAKTLPPDWLQCGEDFARSRRLELDVVPHCKDGTIAFDVLFKNEKAAGQEVVVISPSGEENKLKTDSQGIATCDGAQAGRYAVRARYIEADRSGQRDGKNYSQTWTYCTATFEVAAAKGDSKAAAITPTRTAAEALAAARAARSVWTKNFPGFSADVEVTVEGEKQAGKLKIGGDGTVTLTMPDSKAADWARDQLESMVQHRMPDGRVAEHNVVYADESVPNPLGRKIILNDGTAHSSYRLKDDVIMEVCRMSGPDTRFTISVLEVEWNREKKYLPRSFVINYFDAKTGALNESAAYGNRWQRVGDFDLPCSLVEISAAKGAEVSRRIDFSHVELLHGK